MKTLFCSAVFAGVLAAATGAAAKSLPVLETVGPDSMSTAVSEGTSGGLRVYSGVTVPAFGGEDVKPLENTAYEIRAESGQLIETVQNSYGTRAGDRPPVVTLATGSYRILAWSAQRGLVTVPITIANGRVTTVRFDAAKK